ncbi:MAG: FHA domain-containing protein [Phycisphaerae bacterium]|nr:FHA domain-containing protein [Phycisphaerae bacterium]
MDVKLCLIKGNPKGKTVEVPAGALKVGRAEDSDLIIASTRISRQHCEVVNEGTRLVVRDKGSANGTLVNGKKVQEQVLQPGDELQIGPLTFTVEINGIRKRPASTPPSKPPAAGPGARPQPQATKPQQTPAKRNVPPGPKPAQPQPQTRTAPKDIAATLDRLAGGRANPAAPAKPAKGAGDVLQISDEDLLDADQ